MVKGYFKKKPQSSTVYPFKLFSLSLRKKCQHPEFLWSVFSPNAGKYGPEKPRIRTLFKQCISRQYSLSAPLKNIRKHLVFKCFQGVLKEINSLKYAKWSTWDSYNIFFKHKFDFKFKWFVRNYFYCLNFNNFIKRF